MFNIYSGLAFLALIVCLFLLIRSEQKARKRLRHVSPLTSSIAATRNMSGYDGDGQEPAFVSETEAGRNRSGQD